MLDDVEVDQLGAHHSSPTVSDDQLRCPRADVDSPRHKVLSVYDKLLCRPPGANVATVLELCPNKPGVNQCVHVARDAGLRVSQCLHQFSAADRLHDSNLLHDPGYRLIGQGKLNAVRLRAWGCDSSSDCHANEL